MAGESRLASGRGSITRTELVVLLILVVLGFVFRAWQISGIELDHFDEGVYVFSALGLADPSQPHRLYPDQIRFSPPVYFTLVAFFYSAFHSPVDLTAIMTNVVLGTLTIVAIWWIARSWFGRAGVV